MKLLWPEALTDEIHNILFTNNFMLLNIFIISPAVVFFAMFESQFLHRFTISYCPQNWILSLLLQFISIQTSSTLSWSKNNALTYFDLLDCLFQSWESNYLKSQSLLWSSDVLLKTPIWLAQEWKNNWNIQHPVRQNCIELPCSSTDLFHFYPG